MRQQQPLFIEAPAQRDRVHQENLDNAIAWIRLDHVESRAASIVFSWYPGSDTPVLYCHNAFADVAQEVADLLLAQLADHQAARRQADAQAAALSSVADINLSHCQLQNVLCAWLELIKRRGRWKGYNVTVYWAEATSPPLSFATKLDEELCIRYVSPAVIKATDVTPDGSSQVRAPEEQLWGCQVPHLLASLPLPILALHCSWWHFST